MNLAFVGCGNVATQYVRTLSNYPALRLVGVWDWNEDHLERFLRYFPCRRYASLEDLLADDSVELVVNLTNPRSHYSITRACLEAGKHVYSEKPLALDSDAAFELVALAERKGLLLSAAPCSVLGETAQSLLHYIRSGVIGRPRLVYANFDDGMIAPHQAPWNWRNECGTPWPAKDEFETGCTFEHAGYALTWLAAFFGPVRRVTAFASVLLPDKGIPVDSMAPDFTVACLEYDDTIVARLTCGVVAPRDKSMMIIGDDGVLFVGNIRHDAAPIYLRPHKLSGWRDRVDRRLRWLHRRLELRFPWPGGLGLFQQRLPLVRRPSSSVVSTHKPVDFLRGIADMEEALRLGRPHRLSAPFAAHVVEIVETIQYPERFNHRRTLRSSFPPIGTASAGAWFPSRS